jgi:hypothetical protein
MGGTILVLGAKCGKLSDSVKNKRGFQVVQDKKIYLWIK